MTRYVAGFALAPDSVLMVCKTHPVALAGKFNAVGGLIEQELPLAAMQREFYEETKVPYLSWTFYCKLSGDYPLNRATPSQQSRFDQAQYVGGTGWRDSELFTVYFYHARVPQEFAVPAVNDVGESLLWLSYAEAGDPLRVLPNVTWLLPMARSFALGERAESFEVKEKYLERVISPLRAAGAGL